MLETPFDGLKHPPTRRPDRLPARSGGGPVECMCIRARTRLDRPVTLTESKMPKLKTKSGAKKRFKMTGTGKVRAAGQGKRHGMIKRTAKFIRNARGVMTLNESDARIVKKYMPYAR